MANRLKKFVQGAVLARKVLPGKLQDTPFKSVEYYEDPETELLEEDMNETDENGWGHIHHAAYRGFLKSVERFVKADPDQLELETNDDLKTTPLLLAVMSGSREIVECLIGLGSRINVQNSQNHGAVELCAFKEYIDLLKYFIELNHAKLPVWKHLIKFMCSDIDEEAEAAAKCLKTLSQPSPDEERNQYWDPMFDNGIVPAISKVIKSAIGDQAKTAVLEVFLNLVSDEKTMEQAMASGIMPALVKHLKSSTDLIIQLSAKCINRLCVNKANADIAVQNGALPALVKDLQSVKDAPALVEVCEVLGTICDANPVHRATFGNTQGGIKSVVNLYEDLTDKALQLSLTNTISRISKENIENQNALVSEGVASRIIPLIRLESHKYQDLKMMAVEAVNHLAQKNTNTQRVILEAGIVRPLLHMLKRSRQTETQEKIAGALWSLAGEDTEERRNMAEAKGVQLLVEFLSQQSEELHYIGSEALGVLAQGPTSKAQEIYKNNGVSTAVRLLRSDKEHIVLSIIRTMRALSVGVGFIPFAQNQQTIAHTRGIKFLVALMVHSRNELIQVEAAYTLGCVALGNKENLEEIQQNLDFSYVRILKMMYSQEPMVRLLAGSALAAFAYNNLTNQKEISDQGGVLFRCFEPFLDSDDEFYRCHAAYQIVVLAKIIPDQEQALSSAAGIKLLVDLLEQSKSHNILALTCDCVARLAHTRAGVPSAFVSIDCVNILCRLLENPASQVQGNAAIALSFLSHDHQARRQLLNRCRQNPHLMIILKKYTSTSRLNPEFIEGWKHYKQIGLPPIEEGKQFLIAQKPDNVHLMDDLARPSTNSELGGSTNPYGSGTMMEGERNSLLGSRASRRTLDLGSRGLGSREVSMAGSQHSLVSQRSRQNSSISNKELTPEIAVE